MFDTHTSHTYPHPTHTLHPPTHTHNNRHIKWYEFEWRFYALSAKVILRVRTYSHNLFTQGDDDYLMNETRRKPTTGARCPTLFERWHVIFYMPSRTDTAGHTKAFIFTQSHRHGWTYQGLYLPSHGSLGGKSKCSDRHKADSSCRCRSSVGHANYQPQAPSQRINNYSPGPQRGDLLPLGGGGGVVCEHSPATCRPHPRGIPRGLGATISTEDSVVSYNNEREREREREREERERGTERTRERKKEQRTKER